MKVEKASAVASMFKYYGTEHNKRRHGFNGGCLRDKWFSFGTVMNLTKMKKTSHVPGYELKVIQ